MVASWGERRRRRRTSGNHLQRRCRQHVVGLSDATRGGASAADSRPMMFTYLGGGNLSYVSGYTARGITAATTGRRGRRTSSVSAHRNSRPDLRHGGQFRRGSRCQRQCRPGDGDRLSLANRARLAAPQTIPGLYSVIRSTAAARGRARWSRRPGSIISTYNGQQYMRGASEGSVVRAANGWLVAALRTDMPPQILQRARTTTASKVRLSPSRKDNGQTWSPMNILFDAGRHHANLQLLPNSDLLMTMIVRDDIRSGGWTG